MDSRNSVDLTADIVRSALRSPYVRKLILTLIRDEVRAFTDRCSFRKRLFSPVEKLLAKSIDKKSQGHEGLAGSMGKLMTLLAAERNSAAGAEEKPAGNGAEAFISATDFGEIKEFAVKSRKGVLDSIAGFNRALWKYPGKVASIFSSLIALANTGTAGADALAKPMTKVLGPDLLADIISSLVRQFQADDAGRLMNTVMELIHRLQTGSLLLAKAGRPLLQNEISNALKKAAGQIDPILMRKFSIAIAELKEAASAGLNEAVSEQPEMMIESLKGISAVRNPAIRASLKRARLVEDMDSSNIHAALEKGLADLDVQTLADTVNTCLRIINGIAVANPGLMPGIVRQWADSIDTYELANAYRNLAPGILDSLKPVIYAALPVWLAAFREMLVSYDAPPELQRLGGLLGGIGGAS